MPMLITLRIGLPLCPRHSPPRTRSAKAAMRSSTACTSATTSRPSTSMHSPRGAQCHVQHGAVLGAVDPLAAEHRRGTLRQVAGQRQFAQQAQRVGVDALLGVVQVQVDVRQRERLAAPRIAREQVAQMFAADDGGVLLQRLPGRQCGRQRLVHGIAGPWPLSPSAAALSAIRCSSWFQDLTKASAPSRCSLSASASTSTPAAPTFCTTASASPPSSGITPSSWPCSANACRVFSGIVLIVLGAASVLTYSVSEAFGSLVPVLAHSRRCGCAPAAASFIQRSEASNRR